MYLHVYIYMYMHIYICKHVYTCWHVYMYMPFDHVGDVTSVMITTHWKGETDGTDVLHIVYPNISQFHTYPIITISNYIQLYHHTVISNYINISVYHVSHITYIYITYLSQYIQIHFALIPRSNLPGARQSLRLKLGHGGWLELCEATGELGVKAWGNVQRTGGCLVNGRSDFWFHGKSLGWLKWMIE